MAAPFRVQKVHKVQRVQRGGGIAAFGGDEYICRLAAACVTGTLSRLTGHSERSEESWYAWTMSHIP